MIDRDRAFEVTKQAEMVGIARSTVCYRAADLELMTQIDRLHAEYYSQGLACCADSWLPIGGRTAGST